MTAKQLTKQVQTYERNRKMSIQLVKTSVKVVKKDSGGVSMTLESQPCKIDLRKDVEQKIAYRTKKQSQAAEASRNLFAKKG